MNRSQWLLSLSLILAAAACSDRTGDDNPLPPNSAAIDFYNDSPDSIGVSINNEPPVVIGPNSRRTFVRGFGTYQVKVDDHGDDVSTSFPFQNLGLQDQQTAVMVYRGRRGTRPLIGAESAILFKNESLARAAVYFNDINYGSVAPGQTQVFNVPSGTYEVTVDLFEDGLAVAYPVERATVRPQTLTAMTFR